MKNMKKILDHLIYSFQQQHIHEQPVPMIFQNNPLIWTPHKKTKGKR